MEVDPLLLSTNSVSLGPPFANAATGSPLATLATRADLPDGPQQGAQMSPQLPHMQMQPPLDPNAPIVLSYAGSVPSSVRGVCVCSDTVPHIQSIQIHLVVVLTQAMLTLEERTSTVKFALIVFGQAGK